MNTETNEAVLGALIGPNAARTIVMNYPTLTEIAQAPDDSLLRLANVGAGRLAQLRAAFELAGRISREAMGETPLLDTPERVADLLREESRSYTVEQFHVVLVNVRRRLIRVVKMASGTLDTLLVHPREVFKPAIVANAAAIILSHCHPSSGDPTPSEADIKVTRDLIRAGQLLKIEVLDHVIIGRATIERPRDYVSLRELGYFYS